MKRIFTSLVVSLFLAGAAVADVGKTRFLTVVTSSDTLIAENDIDTVTAAVVQAMGASQVSFRITVTGKSNDGTDSIAVGVQRSLVSGKWTATTWIDSIFQTAASQEQTVIVDLMDSDGPTGRVFDAAGVAKTVAGVGQVRAVLKHLGEAAGDTTLWTVSGHVGVPR